MTCETQRFLFFGKVVKPTPHLSRIPLTQAKDLKDPYTFIYRIPFPPSVFPNSKSLPLFLYRKEASTQEREHSSPLIVRIRSNCSISFAYLLQIVFVCVCVYIYISFSLETS